MKCLVIYEIYWFGLLLLQPPTVIGVDSDNVGKYISTKAVGTFKRHDITDQYKYTEGNMN